MEKYTGSEVSFWVEGLSVNVIMTPLPTLDTLILYSLFTGRQYKLPFLDILLHNNHIPDDNSGPYMRYF